jgi:hypothetical protein
VDDRDALLLGDIGGCEAAYLIQAGSGEHAEQDDPALMRLGLGQVRDDLPELVG